MRTLSRKSLRLDNWTSDLSPQTSGLKTAKIAMPFARIVPGEVTIDSNSWFFFSDNTRDYQKRYKNIYTSQFQEQLEYLDTLLSLLREQKIKVVVFIMPLTPSNRKLLPDSFWSYFIQKISTMCQKHDADWLDIDADWRAFTKEDFVDGVHLNLPGGLKLTRPIALFGAKKIGNVKFDELRRREHSMF